MRFDLLEDDHPPLTRRERRLLRKKGIIEQAPKNSGLRLRNISPKTDNQQRIFEEYQSGQHLLVHGFPGTGKTFLALYLALQDVLDGQGEYNKIVIVRSIVPTRDIGFLPGKQADKVKVYEAPYQQIVSELFGRGDAYEILKNKEQIEFMPTSFIRGVTINDAIVIVDEIQNMTFGEIDSVITRLGENSRLFLCGDYRQSDFKYKDEKQGVHDFMDILHNMKSFAKVEMMQEDIVRSGLVREYIIEKMKKGL